MRIDLPNGDYLVPDAEFLKAAGGVTARTGTNWDKQGCPYIKIKNAKWRPWKEGFAWIAGRIERRNPRRRAQKTTTALTAVAGEKLSDA